MSNCSETLDILFPRNTTGSLDNPGSLTVQSIPGVFVLLVWGLLESSSRLRPVPVLLDSISYGLATLATAGLGILSWRVFDLLDCTDGEEADDWRMLVVIGLPSSAAATLLLNRRLVRVSAFFCLAFAAGATFADWALRELEDAPAAAQPCAAAHSIWAFLAIVCLSHLPVRTATQYASRSKNTFWRAFRSRNKTNPTSKRPITVNVVDPLQTQTPHSVSRASRFFDD